MQSPRSDMHNSRVGSFNVLTPPLEHTPHFSTRELPSSIPALGRTRLTISLYTRPRREQRNMMTFSKPQQSPMTRVVVFTSNALAHRRLTYIRPSVPTPYPRVVYSHCMNTGSAVHVSTSSISDFIGQSSCLSKIFYFIILSSRSLKVVLE